MESPLTTQSDFVGRLPQLYGEPLLTYLTQVLGKAELAREVARDAFARLPTVYQLEQAHFPRALLFKMATNLALTHLRHQNPEDALRVCLTHVGKAPDRRVDPHQKAIADQIGQHLATVIRALRPNLRKAFVMAHVQGKSRSEIAAALGISERRLDGHMTAALKQCRERLAARGIDLAEFI